MFFFAGIAFISSQNYNLMSNCSFFTVVFEVIGRYVWMPKKNSKTYSPHVGHAELNRKSIFLFVKDQFFHSFEIFTEFWPFACICTRWTQFGRCYLLSSVLSVRCDNWIGCISKMKCHWERSITSMSSPSIFVPTSLHTQHTCYAQSQTEMTDRFFLCIINRIEVDLRKKKYTHIQ